MSRLIDGDELLKWMNETQWHTSKMDAVRAKIKSMPSAERKGEWIAIFDDRHRLLQGLKCNLCGGKSLFFIECERNYCPNCGADMRGEHDD